MVEVYHDLCDFPAYDALTEGVTAAWATTSDGSLQEVMCRRTWVAQAFDGAPPPDEEVLRLSKLSPDEDGMVFVSYVPDFAGGTVGVHGYSLPLPPTRARWGLLVLRISTSTPCQQEP